MKINYQFRNILENLEEDNILELSEENFSNEILFNEYLQYAILGKTNFFNCKFERYLKAIVKNVLIF